jgi:hypothetical protein
MNGESPGESSPLPSAHSPVVARHVQHLMSVPDAQLLRSLGRLARGLSALFWGVPAAFIICVTTAKYDLFSISGIVPALVTLFLIYFGLWQMGTFQQQERPWRHALDRAKLTALANIGLAPFLYFLNRFPEEAFFRYGVGALALCGLIFLFNLNLVIAQLGAILPDETLRQETKSFTALNRWMLIVLLLFTSSILFIGRMPTIPINLEAAGQVIWQFRYWVFIFLALLPLAMTMALIWKTKEVIFDSVFGGK